LNRSTGQTARADRIVAWAIRVASTALVFAGVALFVAGLPLLQAASDALRGILIVVLQIGGAFVLCGVGAIAASRLPPPRFPDGASTTTSAGAGLTGWRLALAAALVAVPAWLVFTLQPFLSEWRVVAGLLASSELWDNTNANMSGVLLVPLAAALAPPLIQLAALAAFVATSVVMLALLAAKSARFARLYIASVLLLTALVVGSARGTSAATLTAEALQPWIESSKPRPGEYAEIRGVVDRYTAAVTPTARALGWAWLGFAIWIPPLVLSTRRS
jgi:hypothetical protein